MLDRAKRVVLPLRSNVGGVRFFGGVKPAEKMLFTAVLDVRNPTLLRFIEMGSEQRIFAFGSVLILKVLGIVRQTKIAERIVCAHPVNMVNALFRPFSGHVQPSKAVRSIGLLFNANPCVAAIRHKSGNKILIDANTLDAPSEHAGIRVVMKKFAQSLCAKIGLSHEALQLLIGQRPACVCSTCGPRYFNAGVA